MGKLRFEITMSAGRFRHRAQTPATSTHSASGVSGYTIGSSAFGAGARATGSQGGDTGRDDDLVRESVAANGAIIMGRRMFSGGSGPWEEDPNADAWWGDDPPFHMQVFILTHHPRETVTKQGGTTFNFVTEGIEAALEQARAGRGRQGRRD